MSRKVVFLEYAKIKQVSYKSAQNKSLLHIYKVETMGITNNIYSIMSVKCFCVEEKG